MLASLVVLYHDVRLSIVESGNQHVVYDIQYCLFEFQKNLTHSVRLLRVMVGNLMSHTFGARTLSEFLTNKSFHSCPLYALSPYRTIPHGGKPKFSNIS